MPYCNLTTDLTDVYPLLAQYQQRQILEDWTLATSQTYTFRKSGTGLFNECYENGAQLTSRASIALVEANASSYYYDSGNDILYIRISTGLDPDTTLIEIGDDWSNLLTSCRLDAQELVDSYLVKRYTIPLQPRVKKTHSANDYEFPLRRATAALICYFVINRRNPGHDESMDLYKIAINTEEPKGILNMYLAGELLRQEDVSAKESAGYNYYPYSSNTTDEPGMILEGIYTGNTFQIWKVTITTAGVPGTALFKLSLDNGVTDTYVGQEVIVNTDVFVNLSQGVRARFPAATYVINDYWQIEVFPAQSTLESPRKIESVIMER